MVWYSHLLKNFPQFVVIHTVKGLGVVNKADVFLEFSCFFCDLTDVGILIFSSSLLSAMRVVIHISEVGDIFLGKLDSSLCFIQPSISHDVL